MDDTQSTQMSLHQNKDVWAILWKVIASHDLDADHLKAKEDEFGIFMKSLK